MKYLATNILYLLIFNVYVFGQSVSFRTYMNPVIPGDHPDPTLTRIGNDFYTTGSSFNITPKIYHSTDLVHWEVISQPVSASWNLYGDSPGGGCWGGHMVYYNGSYWHFFGLGSAMYYVKADAPEGPWIEPVELSVPAGIPGLGRDNSIFINDDNRWYLLAKNGQEGNWIVELGADGQPTGDYHDLTWINPAPSYPYSWAEGPVMWKHNGYYYYCFARNVAGGQYVMRSEKLTGDQTYWWAIEEFFQTVPNTYEILFRGPNHCSPAVMLYDSTTWIFSQAYHSNVAWKGQGRQGLLLRVHYDADGNAVAEYTSNQAVTSPDLPSSGIPWMVPHSDYFDSNELNPEWSFSGYTPENTHSLTDRPGWLRLSPRGKANTIVKNDGEHNYSLITRLDFEAASQHDQAGLQIIRGDATEYVRLYSSKNGDDQKVIVFSFDNSRYEAENTVGNTVWLKMIRINHSITGYYSSNGNDWIQVGQDVNISSIDSYTDSNFQIWEGTQQGLYVQGKSADFDLYIYRDAYSPILAQPAANQYGTLRDINGTIPAYLDSIHNHDWALYAGVEFGGQDYYKKPVSVEISAASATSGGVVEVWLDSLDTGQKIAACTIENTGGWDTFETFSADVDSISGNHDVYLNFLGSGRLFRIDWFRFIGETYNPTSVANEPDKNDVIHSFFLQQNYPNPFNPVTKICYSVPQKSDITIKVYNSAGKEVITLYEGVRQKGHYSTIFNGEGLSSGIYYYRIQSGSYSKTQKMILLK